MLWENNIFKKVFSKEYERDRNIVTRCIYHFKQRFKKSGIMEMKKKKKKT